jgi:hypothetical protein
MASCPHAEIYGTSGRQPSFSRPGSFRYETIGFVDATLSKRILGLDWSKHLPWQIGNVAIEVGSYEQHALPFMAEHYSRMFDAKSLHERFMAEEMTDAKRRFMAEMDVLCFRAQGRPVGILMGHPLDWSTYYWRSVALLPSVRDRSLLGTAMDLSYEPLAAAGIHRVEGECSPTNGPMLRTLTKLGWVVTSTSMSERWGATVRFTKFLRQDAGEIFARQFCGVRPPQRPHEENAS